MKLFKEGKGCWAARKHLDDDTDVDIVVQECGSCGRAMTTVTFCRAYCQEGIIPDWGFDWTEIVQHRAGAFCGSERVYKGIAKLYCWSGLPTDIVIHGTKHHINLEYEQ